MKGIITQQGIAAAIQSEAGGYVTKIKLTTYAIGDGAGIEPTGNETNVYGNIVKSGNIADDMTVLRAGDNLLVYKMTMGTDIGDFNVGNIGLFDENGNLFALLVYNQVRPKVAANPPQEPGNILRVQMGLVFANIASAVDVSFIDSATADLPTVATELELPSASVAPHNLYIVQNSSTVGGPAFAYTDGTSWTFTPLTGSTVTAVAVAFTPAGGISATNVQAAIQELDNEKAPKNSPQFLGVPEAPTAAAGTNTNQIATTAFVAGEIAAYDAPADGKVYGRKDGTWEIIPTLGTISLDDLSDVDTTTTPPTNGQALVYDQSQDLWIPGTVSGGGGGIPEAPIDGLTYGRKDADWHQLDLVSALSDLSDVDIDSNPPMDRQALVFDALSGNWIPGDASGGIPEAPNDGSKYARWLETWVAIDDIQEAPSDGNPYARQDGAWINLTGMFLTVANAGATYQPLADKGAANGYAPLNASAKLEDTYLTSNVFFRNGTRSMTADLDFGGFKGTNLSIPTAGTDAATKQYVDNAVSTLALYQGVYQVSANTPDLSDTSSNANGMMWTAVTADPEVPENTSIALPGIPSGTSINHGDRIIWNSLTSAYDLIPSAGITQTQGDLRYLLRDGSSAMTGSLNAGNFKIINLAEGTNPTDAARVSQIPVPALLPEVLSNSGSGFITPSLVGLASNLISVSGTSGTITIDTTTGYNFILNTLTGPATIQMTALASSIGKSGVIVIPNGGNPVTLGSMMKKPENSPDFPATASISTIAYLVINASTVLCSIAVNYQ